MSASAIGMQALAWLLTYAVHSTLLLCAAWLVAARIARTESARESLWKLALLGGLATASVQRLFELEPHAGIIALEGTEELSGAPALDPTGDIALVPDGEKDLLSGLGYLGENALSHDVAPMPFEATGEEPAVHATGTLVTRLATLRDAALAIDWPRWALLAWIGGGGALAFLFALAGARLRDRLAGRRRLRAGPLVTRLEELQKHAGIRRPVRLMISPKLRAPVALGTLFPEICLPPRALDELGPEEQEAMLAHELAHVRRFDPTWLVICRWMETLFFFQPLNRVARARLDHSAEILCDEAAVSWTGNRIGLARCLAEVATWVMGERRALPACGMAGRRSRLAERVSRILEARDEPEHAPRWVAPAGGLALAATVMLAPAFSGPSTRADIETSFAPSAEPIPEGAAVETELAHSAPARAPREAITALRGDLHAEFAELSQDLDILHAELAGEQSLPEELAARLGEIETRTALMRAKKDQIDAMIERWLVASSTTNTTIDAMDRSHQGDMR